NAHSEKTAKFGPLPINELALYSEWPRGSRRPVRTSWCAGSNVATARVLSEPHTSGFAARPKPPPESGRLFRRAQQSHLVRDEGVEGSNPATPTSFSIVSKPCGA